MEKIWLATRRTNRAAMVAVSVSVAACEQFGDLNLPFQNTADAGASSNLIVAENVATETRDVESPSVFQETASGLWDGRPSLGGIWVAHPGVADPERVIIRNQDNGRFVNGALFRRERDQPGPDFQVSSDAAEELGILAGAPATLAVTALRREEVTVPTTAPIVDEALPADLDLPTEDAVATLPAPADIAQAPLEAAAPVASAPLDAINAATAAPAVLSAEAASTIATIVAAGVTAQAAAPIPADVPLLQDANVFAPTTAALPDAAEITSAPLDAAPTASAPLSAIASAAAAAETLPLPAPTTTKSTLEKPFIQVGVFSVERSANQAAAKLSDNGVTPSILSQDSGGIQFWRVLVGPAQTAQDRTAVLGQVQALGFNDAYFVSN